MKRDCNKYKKPASCSKRAPLCFSFFFFKYASYIVYWIGVFLMRKKSKTYHEKISIRDA